MSTTVSAMSTVSSADINMRITSPNFTPHPILHSGHFGYYVTATLIGSIKEFELFNGIHRDSGGWHQTISSTSIQRRFLHGENW